MQLIFYKKKLYNLRLYKFEFLKNIVQKLKIRYKLYFKNVFQNKSFNLTQKCINFYSNLF